MSVGILIADELTIPPGIESLDDFRRWALSDEFPERARIDFIRGMIEVEFMPERLSSHGAVKVEVVRVLANRVWETDLGEIYVDQARVSSPEAALSAEPDIVVLEHETIESGRVRLIPAADADDFVEIEGAPDLVVEIVSPSSVGKDTKRLPPAYFDAGVREYWLIDARGEELVFRLFRRGESGFEETPADREGFRPSGVLGRRYCLDRRRGRRDEWRYDLRESVT
ncbi:MAG TPA: Uma2 family endonuclease [Planctomycetaceae bacterium]